MSLTPLTASIWALAAAGLCGWAVAAALWYRNRREKEGDLRALAEYREVYDSYKLLLDTFNRSNILPWWAHVTKTGSGYDWKINMPPSLQENSIYRLAELRHEGGLWRDGQAPDHVRTKQASADALEAGADGYLLKRTKPSELRAALLDVFTGGAPMSSEVARRVIESFRKRSRTRDEAMPLSAREEEVLVLLSRGYSNKEIADRLELSVDTVRSHLKHIYEKMHVRSRTEAVARYMASNPGLPDMERG